MIASVGLDFGVTVQSIYVIGHLFGTEQLSLDRLYPKTDKTNVRSIR